MRAELHVAPPAIKARRRAIRVAIDHAHRLDLQLGLIRRQERREERRLEGQHPAPVGRGPLGKEQQPVAMRQPLAQQSDLCHRLAPVAPDEDGAGGTRQPADAGPSGDLGLGHEIDRSAGVQCEDVEPRGMVGDHRALPAHRRAADPEAQPQNRQPDAAGDAGDARRDRALHPPDCGLGRAQRQRH